MDRLKEYKSTLFSETALRAIIKKYQELAEIEDREAFDVLQIQRGNETWKYDSIEEFFSEYDPSVEYSWVRIWNDRQLFDLKTANTPHNVKSVLGLERADRELIVTLGNLADSLAEYCFVEELKEEIAAPKPKIFIGHGRSTQWRDLKDHLRDKHEFEIIAYESGERAGHVIRDIIDEMLVRSSFAILVMTAEDKMEDGSMRARQNVIHEIGLFQGKLGFSRAIVLKENGTEEFSNIDGVQQIRYSKNNIKETFGDVLAVLKREFGSNKNSS